jgi:hypothetical protein
MKATLSILMSSSILFGCASQPPVKPGRIDHVVIGVADLDAGIREFAQLTGVQALPGGRHPGRGTQNALVSLGGSSYLEIIAPVPDSPPTDDLRALAAQPHLQPIDFAVSADEERSLRDPLSAAGLRPGESLPGSRVTPAGDTLHWSTFNLVHPLAGGPFFIIWGAGTAHPSTTSPSGCTLAGLSIVTPDFSRMTALRDALGLPLEIGNAKTAALTVHLNCPKGPVTLPAQ